MLLFLNPIHLKGTRTEVCNSSHQIYGYISKKAIYCLVTIVAMSRLVYRKGVDLLALVIPIICKKYPNVSYDTLSLKIVHISFQLNFIDRLTSSLEEMVQNELFLNKPVKEKVFTIEFHCWVLWNQQESMKHC